MPALNCVIEKNADVSSKPYLLPLFYLTKKLLEIVEVQPHFKQNTLTLEHALTCVCVFFLSIKSLILCL